MIMEKKNRKREIALVPNKGSRLSTYSKRRSGLFKKAAEACLLTGSFVAVRGFSHSGRPSSFSSHPSTASMHGFLDSHHACGGTSMQSRPPSSEVQISLADEIAHPEWQIAAKESSLEELMAVERQLQEARLGVAPVLDKLEAKVAVDSAGMGVCQTNDGAQIVAVQERCSSPASTVNCANNKEALDDDFLEGLDLSRKDLGMFSSSSSTVLRDEDIASMILQSDVISFT